MTAPQGEPPHVHRIAKYDPADRDERGGYTGSEKPVSDHGPVEAAYLEAVAAFAEDAGVHRLEIREPEIAGFVNFGLEAPLDGHGLAGLFPPDLSGYHDGAEVPVTVGLELVRAMLRDNGAWCRLEAEGRFFVHVGYDQYVYVGSADPCERALARTRELGLFPERIEASPYAPDFDEPGEQRPADDDFWDRLFLDVPRGGARLLEEGHLQNASRRHRLTRENFEAVRSRLAPRARLTVWPDLSADLDAVRRAIPAEGLIELVREDGQGRVTAVIADEEDRAALTALLDDARAAAVLSMDADERRPLLTGVLPDADGVLRARWRTGPTPGDLRWALLKDFRPGQIRTGTVSRITDFGVFVDLGGVDGMINVAELSWKHIDHPAEAAEVGQEVTVEVLDVDMARERMSLSLKALQDDPLLDFPHPVGRTVTGPVTKLVPFGAFVRVADGFEGLVHISELAGRHLDDPGQAVRIGDEIRVKIIEIDPRLRRIRLSRNQAEETDP